VRIAFDTNVLAYAELGDDPAKFTQAWMLIDAIPPEDTVVPSQVLGELFNVLTRKAGWDRDRAGAALMDWQAVAETVYPDASAFQDALFLATEHRLQIWDGLILAMAALAGCDLLLSEDMQDGFAWKGLTVANPFASQPNPLISPLFRTP
jgi:predicted nucleic acid-binding protein